MSTATDRYLAQSDFPSRAIAGLTSDELRAFPVPDTWSVQQVIVHLLESDLAATHRMRRIAAEDKPLLIAYDETALARSLDYHADDLALVCELFRLNRRFTGAWLQRLPASAFDRAGVHNLNGLVTLGRMVDMYVHHVDHHMTFIRTKRERLGKPLNW